MDSSYSANKITRLQTEIKPQRWETALIVDDHPLFCDALSMTLKAVADLERVESAESLQQALEKLHTYLKPDVVFLDLNLPDSQGLDGLIRIKKAADTAPVVVVSSISDNRAISAVLASKAAGYIPKNSRRDVFRSAFDILRRGDVFTPKGFVDVGHKLQVTSDYEEAVARLKLLTKQQARILQLICEGKLNKQIAYELSIAETTVKAHITAIMRKLGVQSRTQAVVLAKEASFTSLTDG